MNRTLAATALAAALALAGCSAEAPQSPVRISDVVVTLPAVPGRPGAGYFRIEADQPVRILSMASPRAERIELHESRTSETGVTTMARIDGAGAGPEMPLVFEPGGKHAMLFGLDAALKAGDRLPIVIQLDPAGTLEAQAEVRAPGAAAHGGH